MYINGKMRPVETISGMVEGVIQLWYIVKTFAMSQCTPSTTIIKKEKRRKRKNLLVESGAMVCLGYIISY
jgi:hypothetical protein